MKPLILILLALGAVTPGAVRALTAEPAAAAPAAPEAPAAAAGPRIIRNDMAERVQACTLCHGREGRATAQGYFPRLAGKPAGYLFNQLQSFRDGRRPHALMAGLVRNMPDAYLMDIASHFAALDLPYSPPAAPVDAAQARVAERLVRQGDAARQLPACQQCHGVALAGRQGAIPGLLGLPRDYLVAQMGAWKSGQRRAHAPDCMGRVADKLTPDEIGAVAGWLAAQVPGAHPEPASTQPLPLDCGGLTR